MFRWIVAVVAMVAGWSSVPCAQESLLCLNERMPPSLRLQACTQSARELTGYDSRLLAVREAQVSLTLAVQHWQADMDYISAEIRTNPSNPVLYKIRGDVYMRAISKSLSAITEYTEAIKRDGTYASAYGSRALAYASVSQFERAFEDFAHAIKLDAFPARHYTNRGMLYSQRGEREKAIQDFRKALTLDPGQIVSEDMLRVYEVR